MPNYNREDMIRLLEPYFNMYIEKTATGVKLSRTGKDTSTSTNGVLDLHKKPEFANLVNFINQTLAETWELYELKHFPEITYMWANKTFNGGWIDLHNHSPNMFSGVFYVDMESDEMGNIFFQNPNHPLLAMQPQTDPNRNAMNTDTVKVRSGDLIIFPSWLNHGVHENTTDNTRMSIAFDITFKGLTLLNRLKI
jgi:uncharacterized protein (TIGR02466 family)